MTHVVLRALGLVLGIVVAVPLLLLAGKSPAAGATSPVVAPGGSDDDQVAWLPAASRPAVLAAARRYALPPALIAAAHEARPVADVRRLAGAVLDTGRLVGGGWDAARAVQGLGLPASVLTSAADHGYRYSPTMPPIDPDRYVFPLIGPVTYGAFHHDYPATDIFAPIGTPVVACVRAEVLHVSREDVGKGGLSVTLRGEDGWRYYYAHLSVVDDAIEVGSIVEPGAGLGRSGNTGNAKFTAPHLHFGMSKTGYVAGVLSPYPYLNAWPRLPA